MNSSTDGLEIYIEDNYSALAENISEVELDRGPVSDIAYLLVGEVEDDEVGPDLQDALEGGELTIEVGKDGEPIGGYMKGLLEELDSYFEEN